MKRLSACLAFSLALAWTAPSQDCATCHAAIAASYAKTPMARTFGTVLPSAKLPGLDTFTHKPSRQHYSLIQTPGAAPTLERSDESGAHVARKPIHYWIGSGNHARSYISRNPSADLIELPLTWYTEQQGHWAMSPAYDTPQHAGFSRKITYRCMFCHNAYPDLPAGADRYDNATRWPAELPNGIDCQRCHGSGQHHIAAARARKPIAQIRAAITNPARLSPRRRDEVCLQCHLETTKNPLPGFLKLPDRGAFSYRPGEPLENYMLHFDHAAGTGHDNKFEFASAPYRLRQSACYLKSGGQMTCTTCHNPHRVSSSVSYDQSCRSCHAKLPSEHTQQERCASCHMPTGTPDDAIHVTITDHRIVRRPGSLERPVLPPYRGPVALYYPETLADPAKRDLWLGVAQVTQQSNLANGIPQLELALLRWKPLEAQFYSELANAYRAVGRDPRPLYQAALTRDATNISALAGLGTEPELRKAIELTPWNNELHKLLASGLAGAGKLPESIKTLRAALKADPDSGDLWNSLGLALLRSGQVPQAAQALSEAVRLRPELPAIRANFATLLARRKDWAQARAEYEQALALGPQAEVHSAYGLALSDEGDYPAAREQFTAALKLKPDLWNTRNSLGSALEKTGDLTAAIEQYRTAVTLRPDFALAHFNLGVALSKAKSNPEARTSLETAIRLTRQSGDTALLNAAQSALQRISRVP
jgi:tetratricopeptide (TPR) repeat protein